MNQQMMEYLLLTVVLLGVLINFLMLTVAISRRFYLRRKMSEMSEKGDPKYEIASLTLRRTMRIEVGFLIAQCSRLAHTLYVVHGGTNFNYAACERMLVTLLLVWLSVADLMTRNRIQKLLHQLPGGRHDWYEANLV